MDIRGLNIQQIQEKIYPIIADYFKGCKLKSLEEWAFDSFIFDLTELLHLIPKHHIQKFKDDVRFNGASGFIEFDSTATEYQNKTYILMLISGEFNKQAYFLYFQELDNEYNKQRDILIKDFME